MESLVRLGKKGAGAYGIVYSVREEHSGHRLAVKRNIVDGMADFIGSLRELDILVRLKGHPHIVEINSYVRGNPFGRNRGKLSPLPDDGFKDDRIHFVFEEATQDAVKFFKKASWQQVETCFVHLLLAVEYCHSKGIYHRDIKPSNLLVFQNDSTPTLKLCDFGISKPMTFQGNLTPGVVTSWYRAPEILLKQKYDHKVDLWSVGCILYEAVTKIPLLYGSADETDTVIRNLSRFFPEIKPRRMSYRKKTPWQQMIKLLAPINRLEKAGWSWSDFLDLLANLLVVDPTKRFSATQALNHRFFRRHQDYIQAVRQEFPPEPDEEPIIRIHPTYRAPMVAIARNLFRNRQKHRWYTPRIFFQAMSIFDRYLDRLIQEELVDDLKFILEDSPIVFKVCLYVAYKYFSTIQGPGPFSAIYGEISQRRKKVAEQIETNLILSLDHLIYQPTLYEAADQFNYQLSAADLKNLVEIYLEGQVSHQSIDSMKPTEIFQLYRQHIK